MPAEAETATRGEICIVPTEVPRLAGVTSTVSLLVAAVETGGGGRVLEDPDGLVLTAAIPPKLYCTLRIPPADGLTARAIPVVGAWTGVLLTRAIGWTTLPVVPNTTRPVAELRGIEADGLVRDILTGLLLTIVELTERGGVCGGTIAGFDGSCGPMVMLPAGDIRVEVPEGKLFRLVVVILGGLLG